MPDVKISALPAATVPLAGTEVLPIVQSSTTRQVSVANLTAGRAISASSITNSALTSGRVTYAGASGLLTDSANLLYSGTDLTVYGVRVGRGNSAISTNTAVGASALAANTTGADNTALGLNALSSNLSGINNTASGRFALTANTTGVGNTASGYSSLATNIAGNYNTASGGLSLYSNTGSNNTAIGYDALNNNTASSNTAVGYAAGSAITSGSKNSILGSYTGNQGGLDIRTASNYIVLSDGDGNPRIVGFSGGNVGIGNVVDGSLPSSGIWVSPSYDATNSSGIAIGHANGSASGDTYMGFVYNATKIGSITQSGTTAVLYNITSDQRLKTNIVDAPSGNINNIKVRSFDWVTDGNHQTYGLVAQELLEVAPYAVHQPQNSEEMMAVDYSKLVPMMIKEIQDLKARLTALEN
jgi:hypothetical protein